MIARTMVIATCSVFFWCTTAQALEIRALELNKSQKCASFRVNAIRKLQKCVQSWINRRYRRGNINNSRLSNCREKHAAFQSRVEGLSTSSCFGPRFVDNGDGTVTDNLTALIWEKKTDDGSVHDWDNLYTWSTSDGDSNDEDGTVFTEFLSTLNTDGFAGANGWRLPTFVEILTLLLPEPTPCTTSPCIDPAFGPYTQPASYWSATTENALDLFFKTQQVSFSDGSYSIPAKTDAHYARAVRGGSF